MQEASAVQSRTYQVKEHVHDEVQYNFFLCLHTEPHERLVTSTNGLPTNTDGWTSSKVREK